MKRTRMETRPGAREGTFYRVWVREERVGRKWKKVGEARTRRELEMQSGNTGGINAD